MERADLKMHQEHLELLKNRKLTKEIKVEGIGTAKEYGELDLEKLVKRLLQSDAIKGG
jgi:hypothetical protein